MQGRSVSAAVRLSVQRCGCPRKSRNEGGQAPVGSTPPAPPAEIPDCFAFELFTACACPRCHLLLPRQPAAAAAACHVLVCWCSCWQLLLHAAHCLLSHGSNLHSGATAATSHARCLQNRCTTNMPCVLESCQQLLAARPAMPGVGVKLLPLQVRHALPVCSGTHYISVAAGMGLTCAVNACAVLALSLHMAAYAALFNTCSCTSGEAAKLTHACHSSCSLQQTSSTAAQNKSMHLQIQAVQNSIRCAKDLRMIEQS
jgi:hypothetical protein